LDFENGVEEALDALADHVETYMDVDLFLSLAAEV
jgi:adenosylcobyric acid synthase